MFLKDLCIIIKHYIYRINVKNFFFTPLFIDFISKN